MQLELQSAVRYSHYHKRSVANLISNHFQSVHIFFQQVQPSFLLCTPVFLRVLFRLPQLQTMRWCISSNGHANASFARTNSRLKLGEWLLAARLRSCFSRTPRTEWCARSICAEVNSLRATSTGVLCAKSVSRMRLHELWSPEHPIDEFGVQRAHRHTCRLHRLHRRFRDAQHHSIVRAPKHLRVAREPPARPAAGLLCRTAFSERRTSGYRRLPEPYVECACAGGSPDFQLASHLRRELSSLSRGVTTRSTWRSLAASCGWRAASICRPHQKKQWYSTASSELKQRNSRGVGWIRLPRWPLFFSDSRLLVCNSSAELMGEWEVQEFGIGTGGGRFEPRGVILSGRNDKHDERSDFELIPQCCVANDVLIVWNSKQDTISIYSMQLWIT